MQSLLDNCCTAQTVTDASSSHTPRQPHASPKDQASVAGWQPSLLRPKCLYHAPEDTLQPLPSHLDPQLFSRNWNAPGSSLAPALQHTHTLATGTPSPPPRRAPTHPEPTRSLRTPHPFVSSQRPSSSSSRCCRLLALPLAWLCRLPPTCWPPTWPWRSSACRPSTRRVRQSMWRWGCR